MYGCVHSVTELVDTLDHTTDLAQVHHDIQGSHTRTLCVAFVMYYCLNKRYLSLMPVRDGAYGTHR